jgi:hypothetical protein
MRLISVLMAGAVLASCTTAPPAPTRTADKQRDYEMALAGKVPQRPISCLPHYRANDMRTIDENTILFRNGSTTYVAHMRGGCNGLGSGSYALVTRQFGTADLCSGDIAQVVDTVNGTSVGSCVWGEFTPYVRPRA